jgi:hypothetical protein
MIKKIRSAIEHVRATLQKPKDLAQSKGIATDSVRSVCLLLGPYRNLTTLTASTLFLHPNCQVLNHAATRIFGDERIDFLAEYSDERFDAFLRYAIYISQSGKRGQYGGSITYSHAFDDEHAMKDLHAQRAGGSLLKPDIQSLVWKESLRTSNHIRDLKVDLDAIFAKNQKLRFLIPIRCPIDCAISNIKTGHTKLFALGKGEPTVPRVVSAIVAEFAWIENLRKKNPDRFFLFFEHEMGDRVLKELAAFLKLDPNPEWEQAAATAFQSKKRYEHSPELVASYTADVTRHFADDPATAAQFMRFVQG